MKKYLAIGFFLIINYSLLSQIERNSALYKTVMEKDSLLFQIGFNTCDISQFENLLSENFEFFHDKDSISYKKQFIYNLKNGLCSSPSTYQSRRELVEESTEIFPLYKKEVLYGAIQMGVHRFYETMAGKAEMFGSTAKFTHIWILENGLWKLAKSLSYDHQTKYSKGNSIFDNDAAIEEWLKEIKVPALGIGVIKDGKLQQVKVFGELKKGSTAPYNTIFNVASLTKPVTAMVVLKLVSQGKWNLDEPVYKYWTDPDIANDPRSMLLTTRHILSHQTGFPNWRYLKVGQKLSFDFDPGTGYSYSGEGFEYLREVLESKFQKKLEQLADELIFHPLQMVDTKYIWDDTIDTNRCAIGYDKNGNGYKMVKSKNANAADDLLTTIEDYGKFLVSVLNGDGLSKKVREDMVTRQVTTTKGKHFGLGFEIYDFEDGEYALSHGGADEGVQTIFFIFPKSQQGLIIFTNIDDGYKVYEKLLTQYLGAYGQKIFDIETK